MRNIIILLFTAFTASAQTDTVTLTVTEGSVTFSKFALNGPTLNIVYPGELSLVEVGSPSKIVEPLGVIPGFHVYGVDSNFYYRVIMLEDDVAIEVFQPKVGITLTYGSPELLYLAPEPPVITAFKQEIALKRANLARDKLLKEFSKRFNCSQGSVLPVRMPVFDTCRI